MAIVGAAARPGRAGERGAVDAIEERRADKRRKCEPHRILGQAIDGDEGFGLEAIFGETGRELADDVRRDRFGAIEHHAERAEIETFDRFVVDLVEAKPEPKFGEAESVAR